ncbi:MAG: acyloxyacyl hydrolase [Acidobacteria bacterium]|nr:acyloxyacyl hydrolase [Acidobacteriota bacterium]
MRSPTRFRNNGPVNTRGLAIVALLASGIVPALQAAGEGQGPFDTQVTSIQFAGTMLVEAWDKNGSSETLGGGTITLGRAFRGHSMAMLEAIFLRVSEDGLPDPYLAGFSLVLRRRVYEAGPASVFVEGGPGISFADAPTPAGGTRVNYLIQTGFGTMVQVSPGTHVVLGARYLHVSNNSLAGRNRNPDIQTVGGYLGVILRY